VSIHSYQSLGQIGCVTEILNPGVLEVLINGKKQTYVALCLLHAPGERISELHITLVNYIISSKQLLHIRMCTTANKQEVHPSGESTTEAAASLRKALQKSPSQVGYL